jgi:hypothetical protein
VRRAAARWIVVIALIFSVGAHWAFIQSVAWLGMTVSYAQKAPLVEALTKTFDGQHPCEICKFVQEGQKKAEHEKEFHKLDLRLDLVFHGQQTFLNCPCLVPLELLGVAIWTSRNDSPPLPPPRVS